MENKDLLVIIVTYNAIAWLDKCLGSCMNSTVKNDVFVVDNGSTDGTPVKIEEEYPMVIFKQAPYNLGFGMANNIGLQYALDHGYKYVYLLNQDAWVMEDTFEILIDAQKEEPDFGVLSPLQMQANMVHLDTYFRDIVSRKYKNDDLLESLLFKREHKLVEVHDVMAAHWLISRTCLLKVGGFSSSFKHYGEDNNFSSRVIFKGLKNGICISAKAVHDRENRQSSYRRTIFMDYIHTLVMANDLNYNQVFKLLAKNVLFSISKVMKGFSFYPLQCSLKLLFNYRSIYKNRIRSLENGAFLNVD